jgi:hypothetical protein
MFSRALGRLFDFGTGWAPVDIDTANGATGKRVSLSGASGITFLVTTGTGGAEDLVLDVQQHTAYTGGTSADLDSTAVATSTGVTEFHIKAETALDNDEAWVAVTQAEASECTVVGATYGAMQKVIAIYIGAPQLGDGYSHVSLNAAITTSTAQLSSCTYVLHDLSVQRKATNLPNLLRPGAANA